MLKRFLISNKLKKTNKSPGKDVKSSTYSRALYTINVELVVPSTSSKNRVLKLHPARDIYASSQRNCILCIARFRTIALKLCSFSPAFRNSRKEIVRYFTA